MQYQALDSKISFQLLGMIGNSVVGNHIDHPAVLHHEVAVSYGGGKVEILFHQQNGVSLVLEVPYDIADVPDDQRCKPLRGLIQQQPGSGTQNAGYGQHLSFSAA